MNILDLGRFSWSRLSRRIKVPTEPHFDSESTDLFKDLLAKSSFYLEYGMGGSTFLAHQSGKTFLSIESDPLFYNAVCDKLSAGPNQRLRLFELGIIGPWSVPVFKSGPLAKTDLWREYVCSCWSEVSGPALPDLVLIDGRFRKACLVQSLIMLASSPDAQILVDDYVGRPYYHEVESICPLPLLVAEWLSLGQATLTFHLRMRL